MLPLFRRFRRRSAEKIWGFAEDIWDIVFPRRTTYTTTLLVLSVVRFIFWGIVLLAAVFLNELGPFVDWNVYRVFFSLAVLPSCLLIAFSLVVDDGAIASVSGSGSGVRNRALVATTWRWTSGIIALYWIARYAVPSFALETLPEFLVVACGAAAATGLTHGAITACTWFMFRAQFLDLRDRFSHRSSWAFSGWTDADHADFLRKARRRPSYLPDAASLSSAALNHYAAYCEDRAVLRRSAGEALLLLGGGGLGLALSVAVQGGGTSEAVPVAGPSTTSGGDLGRSQAFDGYAALDPGWYIVVGALLVGLLGARLVTIETKRWEEYARGYRSES